MPQRCLVSRSTELRATSFRNLSTYHDLLSPGYLSLAGREPGRRVVADLSAISEGFVAVGSTGDLAPGEMKFVAVDRERVVLANIDGTFYALRDVCGHRNAPLSRGRLIGCLIECPLHFAQFDMRTGKLVDGPVSGDIAVYEVRIESSVIYVKQ